MSREIQLSKQGNKNRGKYVAIVDDSDFDLVNQYRWCAMPTRNTIYAVRFDKKKCITMHSFLMSEEMQNGSQVVDHRDGNGLNNTRMNLRPATYMMNFWNGRLRFGRKFKGVTKRGKRFQARIMRAGESISLGTFSTEIEAASAYDVAARRLYGEFARLNDVSPD